MDLHGLLQGQLHLFFFFISAASQPKDTDVCKLVKDIFLNCVLHFEIPETLYSGI
jgi:hypothetical protein